MFGQRNVYAVRVILNGNCKTMWIKATDEIEARERALAEMFYGGRIMDVSLVTSHSPSRVNGF